MQSNTKKKRDTVISALVYTLILGVTGTVLIALKWRLGITGIVGVLMLLGAAADLGMIIPIWILVKTRFKEIEGGEEDVAAQY